MLTHAFETWQVLPRLPPHRRPQRRSAAAIERIGGKFEGILRAHRMAADHIARDSKRFSILAAEWPEAKQQLRRRLRSTNARLDRTLLSPAFVVDFAGNKSSESWTT